MSGETPFTNGNQSKVWEKYCGFLDLTTQEFLGAQKHLLLEEIDVMAGTPIGQKLMKRDGASFKPTTVEEFRKFVPITSWDDYAPLIGKCQEDGLPGKPVCWARTSGRGGDPKWVPYTRKALEWMGINGVAIFILSCATKRGDVKVNEKTRILQNLPPRPYFSGFAALAFMQEMNLHLIPPFESAEKMTFEERLKAGYAMALRTGVDVISSLTAVQVKMGEQFAEGQRRMKLSWAMMNPRVLLHLSQAIIRSKREKRRLLPKDLWPVKSLVCYGTDTVFFKKQLMYYWGKEPYEVYAGTEMGVISMQSWTRKGLPFTPFSCFLEFAPEEEWLKRLANKDYQPKTVLLDEVEEGKSYELIITSFHGLPFLRYRIGDVITIVSKQDDEAGINIPHMVFKRRGDDIIDLSGFARLDERAIWQALLDAQVKFVDFVARKEYEREKPVLHLYVELKENEDATDLERRIDQVLCSSHSDYSDVETMAGIKPFKLSVLPAGTFQRYTEIKRKAGADLAHFKPPHINPSDQVMRDIEAAAEKEV